MKVNKDRDYIGKFFSREKRNDILSQFGQRFGESLDLNNVVIEAV